MSEIDKKNDSELNTSNIFDEFEVDEETRQEIEEINIEKDSIYYMNKIGSGLKYANYVLLFIVLITGSYVYIQKSESEIFNDKYYLESICDVLNGKGISIGDNCSSLSIAENMIESKVSSLNKEYLKKIVPILTKSYEIESIKNSKESIFIIDKSKNKNDPLFILNEFDIIKNNFTGVDKQKIRCENVKISGNTLEASCTSYSTAWYSDIPGLKGEKTINTISGTSVTLAASFINYISKQDNFSIVDKQKTFETTPYFGEGNYIYKTDFKLKIEYNNNSLTF